jgi:hypothetical protein
VKRVIDGSQVFLIAALFFSFSFYLFIPVSFKVPGFTSFSLTKVLSIACLLVYAVKVAVDRKIIMPKSALFIALTAVVGIISAFFTEMQVDNVKFAMNFAAGGVIFVAVYTALKENSRMKHYIYTAIVAGGIMEIAAAFLEYFSGNKFDCLFRFFRPWGTYDTVLNMRHENAMLHWDYSGMLRVSGFLSDTNHLASFLFIFLVLVAGLYFLKNTTKSVFLTAVVLFTAGCQALILTYSRSSLGSLVIALSILTVLTFIFAVDSEQRKKVLLLTLIFIALVLSNLNSTSQIKNRFSDASGGDRLNLQKAAINMEGERVKKSLVGLGYATFGRRIHFDPKYVFPGINEGMSATITSPHSVYLGILLASGVIGLGSFLVFGFITGFRLFKASKNHNIEAIVWLAMLVGWAAAGLLGKDLYIIEESVMFFALAAVAFYNSEAVEA